jgi:hypothetical protein
MYESVRSPGPSTAMIPAVITLVDARLFPNLSRDLDTFAKTEDSFKMQIANASIQARKLDLAATGCEIAPTDFFCQPCSPNFIRCRDSDSTAGVRQYLLKKGGEVRRLRGGKSSPLGGDHPLQHLESALSLFHCSAPSSSLSFLV